MTAMSALNDKYLAKIAAGQQGPKRAALAQEEVAHRAKAAELLDGVRDAFDEDAVLAVEHTGDGFALTVRENGAEGHFVLTDAAGWRFA